MTSTPSRVVVAGAAQAPYTRHAAPNTTTPAVLAQAVRFALADAGLRATDVDGLGVSSFTLAPDHAVDLAWRLGLKSNWLMEDTNGGASAGGMLQHAMRAIEAGDASVIVLVAGDHFGDDDFTRLVHNYNQATVDHLAPLPATGPNALFAMLTQRQMARLQLTREDYGRLVVSQRSWATQNPGAVYRTPLALQEYLDAPLVADPLGRYDCVPPVTGADAIIVTTDGRVPGRHPRILAVTTSYHSGDQLGDGLRTGVAQCAPLAWEQSGVDPDDVDVISVYDDYPAMVIAQLVDLGLTPADDVSRFISEEIFTRRRAVNTSGGQLSAGQAGAAGGMHGVVEIVQQLRQRAGDRQVAARLGVVSGYGMVLYRHGACGNVAVLEAAE